MDSTVTRASFTTLAGALGGEAGYVVAVPRFPVSSDDFAVLDPAVFDARIADLPEQAVDVAFVVDRVAPMVDARGSRRSSIGSASTGCRLDR